VWQARREGERGWWGAQAQAQAKALSFATPQALRVHNNHKPSGNVATSSAIRNNVAHSRRARYSAKAIM